MPREKYRSDVVIAIVKKHDGPDDVHETLIYPRVSRLPNV